MKLYFLGGADEVGASCTLIEIEGRRLLVDAGIRMGAASGEHLPNLSLIDDVGAPEEVLITHAHSDHTGALPALVPGLSREVPLRCTPPTRAITSVLLNDALKIMQLRDEREGDLPLYPPEAVEMALARIEEVPYLTTLPICGGALKGTWIPSGHILGAASVYIEGERESLLISGDVSVADQRTIPGMVVPRCRPDVVVLETTYGNRRHADRAQQERALAVKVAEVVEAGGKVLIPAFAVGRAQEVILILGQAMRRGEIPAFPVWVDGMVRAVNAVYASFPESLTPPVRRRIKRGESPFYTDSIRPLHSSAERQQVLDGPPCCIVASSGMLTGGASAFYATRLAAGPENLIAITGYQDEEAPGRALLNLARSSSDTDRVLTLNGQRVAVSCRVEPYSLSAHADSGELAALVQRLEPGSACLVHGDEEARGALATVLDLQLPGGVHLPENGGTYSSEKAQIRGAERRYGGAVSRLGLGGGRKIDANALAEIGTYLRETGEEKLLRVQDLTEIWCGTENTSLDEVKAFRNLLDGPQDLFIADRKRPYLFRIAARDAAAEPSGPMEMNLARTRIQATFPPRTGLFRCSVHAEEKIYELAFHFPDIIRARYSDQLQALEEETGWAIQVRETPHQERLFEEALACVPGEATVIKAPALHLERREVSVGIDLPADLSISWAQLAEEADRRFTEATGYALALVRPEIQAPAAVDLPAAWEINRAYAQIREAFSEQAHAPYRIGRKTDSKGAYIEVAFISPAVGARHEDLLLQLAAQTGWPMRIRQAINQQQISETARRLTPPDCGLRGTPRLFLIESCVVVPVGKLPPAEEIPALEETFEEATGFQISWEVT